MKNTFYCFFISIISFCRLASAQDNTTKQQPFQTAIFIHTSKPQYLSGEKIWLSAYLFNASTQQLLVHMHPLYVQLYAADGKLIADEILYTEAGRGSGSIALLASTPPGIYRLQAFTQSMVMAKQASYEQRIYVGVQPTFDEPKTESKISNLLKIVSDSSKYPRRSPIKLLLQADTTLEATFSVSVYKETSTTSINKLILHSKTSMIDISEPTETLLYMGRALRAKGSAVVNGQVVLLVGQKTYMASTDSVGFFVFNNLDLEGEQTAYWQVNNTKGKELTDATIHWIKFPRIPLKIDSLMVTKQSIQPIKQPVVFKSDGDSLAASSKILEQVTIKAKKQEDDILLKLPLLHKESDVSYAINFENNQLSNDDPRNFNKMLQFLPPCFLRDKPKYLLDGALIDKPEEVIDNRQIKRIELLRGINGLVYGSGCVYAIYTYGIEKYTKKDMPKPNKTVKMQNYQPIQAFYSPKYESKNNIEPDKRQTLYWNPALVLEHTQKEIPIRFFSSDMNGTYRVVVQGISNQGVVYAETSFRVE